MATGVVSEILELGWFRPQPVAAETLAAGEVGYVATGLKSIAEAPVGDTLTTARHPAPEPLPGYRPALPLVFAGIYPLRGDEYPLLRDALDKLHLNDASFVWEPESSVALGHGFRCGFLGLLHMEIVQERLEREFGLDLIASAPSVEYRVRRIGGSEVAVDNPASMPPPGEIEDIAEPWVGVQVITPNRVRWPGDGAGHRPPGHVPDHGVPRPASGDPRFEMPLAELIVDFYDQLKGRSSGYASLDYAFIGYRSGDLVKLDILVNGEPVDALSLIVHRTNAPRIGRSLVEKLKDADPAPVVRGAGPGGHRFARSSAARRSGPIARTSLAKCYGGDITRKRKLLEKQKEGKQRMKRVGTVEIPQEAFLAVLRMNETTGT